MDTVAFDLRLPKLADRYALKNINDNVFYRMEYL